ncbi:MAG: nucleoside triphosphate pyrophosphohydrolase [Oscillospiraceae bacterium]
MSIMELLRSEKGCPWDREQTHHTIRSNFIEETYEVVEAIDNEDTELLKEELGDVLLQVVFHAQMEKEAGSFDFSDVCDGICKKLILRHPHIFADEKAGTSQEVLRNWDAIKRAEKHRDTVADSLKSVPRPLPALMRSAKVQNRAAKCGFDYPDPAMALGDLRSEVDELTEALEQGDRQAVEEELGDLLFSAVNVSRLMQIDPEQALTKSCDKFIRRFEQVERLATAKGIEIEKAQIQVLDNLWKEAKKLNK